MRLGIFHDIITILKIAGEEMSELEKLCILEYDEMHVKEGFEYDEKRDCIMGSHSLMQVVMVRGLFGGWKQTIMAQFDFTMTKEKLIEIIKLLHDIDYIVVGVVSDLSTGNQGVISKLIEKFDGETFFPHPSDSDLKVFVFADAPHLLKLIRNWLCDKGFQISAPDISGTISKHVLRELIQLSSTEVSSCFRLTDNHISCQKTARQNVSLASQLLSHTTAKALERYFPSNPEALRLATFIETVNNWFDIFNSRHTGEGLKLKRPYGLHLEEQNEALTKMINLAKGMLPIGKKSIQVFQKAIIMSSNSLINMYEYLKQKHEFDFILTKRLNQDCLESHFSHIRGKGGLDDRPSPKTCLTRIKLISLGKNCGTVKRNTNTSNDNEEFLLAKVFKAVQINTKISEEVDNDDSVGFHNDAEQEGLSSDEENFESYATKPELDGIEYLAGWVAFKFKDKFPELGTYTYKLPTSQPSWVQHLSFGGLICPSATWLKNAQKIECEFNIHHGETFQSTMSVVQILTSKISKKLPCLDISVLKKYVKQRTIIRCRYLNKKSHLSKQKREFKKSTETKQQQKMRKLNYFS